MKRKIITIAALGMALGLMLNVRPLYSATAAVPPLTLDSSDFDGSSVLFDPSYKSGASNIGGGVFIDSATIPLSNTDAIGFRIKNLTDTAYPINTLYIQNTGNWSYSLMQSVVRFVSIDGTETTVTGNPQFRNSIVPASFDGVMIVDWNQVVNIKSGTSSYYWTSRSDEFKLSKDATNPALMYPSTNFSYMSIYFNNNEAANAGVNELLFGDVYTFNYADTSYQKYDNPFTLVGETVIPEVAVSYYPTTQATYSFEVNGVAGTSDDSIDLNVSGTISVNYGYTLTLNPTLSPGYILSYIEVDGSIIDGYSVKNTDKSNSTHVVNFVTAEMYSYAIGANSTISLLDKVGVQVNVNNTLGETINYTFVMVDSNEIEYTASPTGVGIISKTGGYTYYGNVFSIPSGFNGSIFIPFNAVRGSTYGGINNLPWNRDLPAAVSNVIRLNYVSSDTINRTSLETVFSNWSFVNVAPSLSNAPAAQIETSYSSGIAASLDKSLINYFTQAPYVRLFPSENIPLDSLGIGLRFKNKGQNDIVIRPFIIGDNGVNYVPSTTHQYSRIDAMTDIEETLTGNRNIVVPVGFDGTIIINMAYYSSDSLSVLGTEASNINFKNIKVSAVTLFLNMTTDDFLFISPTMLSIDTNGQPHVYDNTISLGTSTTGTASRDGTIYTPSITSITNNALSVTVDGIIDDGSKVTVNLTSLELGDILTIITKPGYVIERAVLNGQQLTPEPDGSYRYHVKTSFTTDHVLEIFTTEKWQIDFDYDVNSGSVTVLGEVPPDSYYSPNSEVSFSVEPQLGYELVGVYHGEDELEAIDEVYYVTMTEDIEIRIVFALIDYAITYELDGGTNASTNPDTYTIKDTIIFSDAVKEGYVFIGWYILDEEEQKVPITRLSPGSYGSITIYAEFEEVEMPLPEPDDPKPALPLEVIIPVAAGSTVGIGGIVTLIVFIIKKKRPI